MAFPHELAASVQAYWIDQTSDAILVAFLLCMYPLAMWAWALAMLHTRISKREGKGQAAARNIIANVAMPHSPPDASGERHESNAT